MNDVSGVAPFNGRHVMTEPCKFMGQSGAFALAVRDVEGYVARHACGRNLDCLWTHSHMWSYGGWKLERPDRTGVRIWKGRIKDVRA